MPALREIGASAALSSAYDDKAYVRPPKACF
jgi:hypothetical protein